MDRPAGVVFINSASDTFTPTISGALSTWIWEVCNAARRDGFEPWVIARAAREKPWDWPRTILIDYPYPKALRIRGAGRFYELQKRWMGWGHVHQGNYMRLLVAGIQKAGLTHGPFFLQNDMEAAVLLRHSFPDARVIHLAQNNNTCSGKFRRRFGKSVDLALAVSKYCAEWNVEYFNCPVETLYSGVNTDIFAPSDRRAGGLPVINFHGRTSRVKGLDILFDAAISLAMAGYRFQIQALGSTHWDHTELDDYQRHLASQALELDRLGVVVRRPGHIGRHALPDELRKADIHCIPARWDEPFGLTTLEGMACGLATVASRTGGTPEILGDAGLLFERENVQQLTQCLERLITDEDLRLHYALKARQRAENFTWCKTWHRIRPIIDDSWGASTENRHD